jgi:hypothetical protein
MDILVEPQLEPVHNVMVHLPGSKVSFRCECGCNVFHKKDKDDNKFICNACFAVYTGEK